MHVSGRPSRRAVIVTLAAALAWLLVVLLWLGRSYPPAISLEPIGLPEQSISSEILFAAVFGAATLVALYWIAWGWRRGVVARRATLSLSGLMLWQTAVYFSDYLD